MTIHKQFEKINLDSIENIKRIKLLIDSGMNSGALKRKHGVSKNSYELIAKDKIALGEDFIKCEVCQKSLDYVRDNHLTFCSGLTVEQYFDKYPEAKFIASGVIIGRSKKNIGKTISESARQKLQDHNLGKKHSPETIAKLSALTAGDKNPSKRSDVKKLLKENHTSRKNPQRWREIIDANTERTKGIPLTESHKQALAEGRERSSKYGSKPQLYAFRYLKRYFGLFHKLEVRSNDSSPFKGHTDAFNVDITIPELKIAIEWDGIWHREPIFGEEHLGKVQANDRAKNAILKSRGWSVYRIQDDCPNGHQMKQFVKDRCRNWLFLLRK